MSSFDGWDDIDPDLLNFIGDDAADWALASFGISKKLPGWSELEICCERDDDPLEVFRRSWLLALKDTSRGDDG